jgi:hypothetical protein
MASDGATGLVLVSGAKAIICISLFEMNGILVVVDIQDIHESKNMT